MKTLLRVITFAAGFAVASMPFIRAADATQPPPDTHNNSEGQTARPERRGGRMRPAQMIKHLTEVLNLTEDQQAKLEAIFKQEAIERRAIRKDSSLSREDRRVKMRELMKNQQAQIRAILTPEQQKKLDTMPQPDRRIRGEKRDGGPPAPSPAN